MKTAYSILTIATTILLFSCEIYDDIAISAKHKAVVHLLYHYESREAAAMDNIESMRLFIYNSNGDLFREVTIPPAEFNQRVAVMQTYLPNGKYSFVSWANVGNQTSSTPNQLPAAYLSMATTGADPLFFGRCETSITKGDSLFFNIHLFKSVFKVNVRIEGLETTQYPENHFFGTMNREGLSFNNKPIGELQQYCPALAYQAGVIAGSFYTPYFTKDDDFTVGVYCDNPNSQYKTLCETTIRQFSNFTEDSIGKDIEINVDIVIKNSTINIVISDWNGTIIQEEHLGV